MCIWNNINVFGQSHGYCVGILIKHIPAGIKIDNSFINQMLERRKSGKIGSTSRIEEDKPIIISGINEGYTTGENICVIFKNNNVENDGIDRNIIPRPSHADYTAHIASKGHADLKGGGAYSGRLTLGIAFAGAIAKQFLAMRDIEVLAKLKSVGYISDIDIDTVNIDIDAIMDCQNKDIAMISEASRNQALELIKQVAYQGDSLSSTIECLIYNMPVGIGDNYFESCESLLSQGIFAVPGVKGIRFGKNPNTLIYGSNYNDPFKYQGNKVVTSTNNCGGVQGGRTNGMPIYFSVDMKPTPSIAISQQSVNLIDKTNTTIDASGRNDACIGIRAVAVVESIAALWAMYSIIGLNE